MNIIQSSGLATTRRTALLGGTLGMLTLLGAGCFQRSNAKIQSDPDKDESWIGNPKAEDPHPLTRKAPAAIDRKDIINSIGPKLVLAFGDPVSPNFREEYYRLSRAWHRK